MIDIVQCPHKQHSVLFTVGFKTWACLPQYLNSPSLISPECHIQGCFIALISVKKKHISPWNDGGRICTFGVLEKRPHHLAQCHI